MTSTQIEQRLRATLKKEQADEQLGYRIHTAIGEVLTSFVGKKLTKRFTDKVDAAVRPLVPEHPVLYWEHPGKMTLWGNGIAYDQRWSFYIASQNVLSNPSHSVHCPTLEGFEQEDACHGSAARERIVERERILSNPKSLGSLATTIATLRKAKADFERATDSIGWTLWHEAARIVKE